jgi:ABC-type sugar transport system permease subunit
MLARMSSGQTSLLASSRRSRRSAPSRWLDRLSDGRFAMVIALPGLVLVGVFVLLPIVVAVAMSTFRIELLRDDFTPFVAFRNYAVRLPADTAFLGTLPLTLAFAVVTSALAVPLALATALLIDGRGRLSGVLAVVLLLPWAVAPIADGILWRLLVDPRSGIVSYLLTVVGLPPVVVREVAGTFVAMVVAVTWRAIPLLAILFLSALRVVRPEVKRAARLDGASSVGVFRWVTLPALAPVVVVGCLLQVILALQVFEVQYAMSAGDPPRGSTLAGMAIFDTVIGQISLGYGSAMTMVLAAVIAVCLVGLYLVIRPRRARSVSPERPDGLVAAPLRPPAGAWIRSTPDAERRSDLQESAFGGSNRFRRGLGRARRAGTAALAAAVTLLLVIWLVGPLIWIAIASTQPASALARMPPRLTAAVDLSGYLDVITDPAWQGAAVVSVTVSVAATLLALIVGLLAGYPLARLRMRGTQLLLLALLATMLIPPIALAIPVLFLVIDLGIRDTILGLILINAAFWSPILIWLVRSAFVRVPLELERAARIDGSSRLGTIIRISLPAAAPVIAAATAIVFIGIWNDFVFSAVVGGRETQSLARSLGESPSPLFNVLSARIVLTVAPCIALVVLLRSRILRLG